MLPRPHKKPLASKAPAPKAGAATAKPAPRPAKAPPPKAPPPKAPPPKAAPPPEDTYAEEARTLAAEFVEQAPWKVDEAVDELDLSIDSIRVLDRACRFQRKAFDDRYILCAGFYFAEMLRRAYKGRYRWDERSQALALDVEGLSILPIEKIRKVVAGQDNASLQEFLLILAKKIADRRGYGISPEAKANPPAVDPK